MNQEQFAVFLGYDSITSGVRAISRWENGREPRGASLRRLCARTGKSAGFFLGTEDAEEEARLGRLEQAEAALELMIAGLRAKKLELAEREVPA